MNTIQDTLLSAVDLSSNQRGVPADASAQEVGAQIASFNKENAKPSVNSENELAPETTIEQSTQFFAEIKENLQKINDFIPVQSTNLVFEFDELGDPPIVKVVDKGNDEVIREIPSQEFREVAKAIENLADKLTSSSGILFNDLA